MIARISKRMGNEKRMELDNLGYELENLQKLHTDLEKQMLSFDEVVPFERQTTAKIFSPRLINMMLACGPQIEGVTRIIGRRCNIKDGSIPSLIQQINEKAVLSNLLIISVLHNIQFTPFTKDLEWWQIYNGLKHDLATNQSKLNYTTVMDALASLSALHCLANQLMLVFDEDIPKVLDRQGWKLDSTMQITTDGNSYSAFWKSLLFQINNTFKHTILSR